MSNRNHILLSIEKELQAILKRFRGKDNKVRARRQISTILTEYFNYAISMRKLDQGTVEHVTTLWKSWTIKNKAIWLVMNRLGIGKREIHTYRDAELIIISTTRSLVMDETERENTLSKVLQYYKEKYYKYWYENSPKSVILANLTIQPGIPIHSIEISFEI